MSNAEGIHNRCWELIRALDIPVPCREPDMLAATRLHLNRHIFLNEWHFSGGITGLVVDGPQAATCIEIWVDRTLNPFHRRHVIAHELGHVLLGHTAHSSVSKHLCAIENSPPMSADSAALDRAHSMHVHGVEDEAELFALLLLGQRDPEEPTRPLRRRRMSEPALSRLERAFPGTQSAVGAERERLA